MKIVVKVLTVVDGQLVELDREVDLSPSQMFLVTMEYLNGATMEFRCGGAFQRHELTANGCRVMGVGTDTSGTPRVLLSALDISMSTESDFRTYK